MFLTGPQAQTRQQQLALIRIALIIRIRDHHLGDRPDLLDGFPGVGEPPQVGVAGDEMTTQRDKLGSSWMVRRSSALLLEAPRKEFRRRACRRGSQRSFECFNL
jgi:hypothetical protein